MTYYAPPVEEAKKIKKLSKEDQRKWIDLFNFYMAKLKDAKKAVEKTWQEFEALA
jgi:truncated hemoglobin YjbI